MITTLIALTTPLFAGTVLFDGVGEVPSILSSLETRLNLRSYDSPKKVG